MKKFALLLLLITLCNFKSAFSQKVEKVDSLGLPGDNLNLYAVLDLFQKSETFEIFEKQLNLEDSKVNNLDLNNDDKTDYIKVVDHKTGESHAVVLQAIINEKETQDVAVIEIEKDKNGKVIVQIVGNEELYGKDYIVEPVENDPTAKVPDTNLNKKVDTTVSKDGKTIIINNTTNNYNTTTVADNSPETYVVVNSWPIVHYVYGPSYVVYASPWYWHYYPIWWQPWSPWYWHNYYWHHHNHFYSHHHGYYHRTTHYRAPVAHGYYGPRRSTSATVQNNRTANVYHRTYDSKNRTGDGRIKSGTKNPVYDSKPVNKQVTPDNRKRPGNEVNKQTQKPDVNRPATKIENRQPNRVNKPATRPSNKQAPRQSAPKTQKKVGGGRK